MSISFTIEIISLSRWVSKHHVLLLNYIQLLLKYKFFNFLTHLNSLAFQIDLFVLPENLGVIGLHISQEMKSS